MILNKNCKSNFKTHHFFQQLRVVNSFDLKVDRISDILVFIKLSLLLVDGSTCFSHKVTEIISPDEDR